MTIDRVTVLGGTGFVGTELVTQMAGVAREVTVLTRRSQRFKNLKVLDNVSVVEVDVHREEALTDALRGSDVVVNLVGILNQSDSSGPWSFEGAHAELTRKVVTAAQVAGVPRYLHMSALGADAENGSSEYLRTKGQGENYVKELSGNNLQWTFFRPSVIFGESDSFFNRFRDLLQVLPVFPLACPDSKMAPVSVHDVCNVMVQSMTDNSTHGEAIHLCGPNVYTLRQIVEMTRDAMGVKRPIIGLPDFAARLQARVMEWVPGKPFSRDNYLSLQTDSVCPGDCASQPTSVEAMLPRYIGEGGKRGRLQTARKYASRDL